MERSSNYEVRILNLDDVWGVLEGWSAVGGRCFSMGRLGGRGVVDGRGIGRVGCRDC